MFRSDVSVFYFVAPTPDPYHAWEGDFFREQADAIRVRDKINEIATRKPYKVYVSTMLVKDEVGVKPEPVVHQQVIQPPPMRVIQPVVDHTTVVDAPISLAEINGTLKKASAPRQYRTTGYTRSVRTRDGTITVQPKVDESTLDHLQQGP